MGLGGQRQDPAALPPEKRQFTHCIGCCVGPQIRYGRVRKMLPSPGFDPRTVQPVANLYPGPCMYSVQYTNSLYIYHILSSKFRRISPAPDLRVPKYCVITGVSAVSLMRISYMILLYNRCTSYHRM